MKKYDPVLAKLKRHAAAKRREAELEERRWQRHIRLNGEYYELTKDVRVNAMRIERHIRSHWFMRGKSRWSKEVENERKQCLRELLKSDAPFLYANNPEARVRFFPAWRYNLKHFAFAKKVYLVTLTPQQYVLPIDEARNFNMRKLQSWARTAMLGFDYVGIVEVAHYSEAQRGPGAGAQISFHVHIIAVAPDYSKLNERIAEINRNNSSLVPGRPCADVRHVKHIDLGLVLKYMIKDPINDYRIYPVRDEIDDDLGVVRKIDTEKSKQTDKFLSPGMQLRVRRVTRHWTLDKMIFAGGSGQETLKAIREDALRGLPWSKRRGERRRFSGCFEYDDYQPAQPKVGSWVGVDGFIPELSDDPIIRRQINWLVNARSAHADDR